MTDSPQPGRPQQVTTAVVLSVAACVLAVVNLFSTRDDLRGTAFRDSLTQAQDQAGGLGASNEQLVAVLEVLVFVSGALAAAAAVLAIYAWQRNRAAWIGFFVLAGLLALTLPVAGILPVLLLASGATFLASRPARDWYAGRAPAPSGSAPGRNLTLSQDGPGPDPGRPEPPPYGGSFGSGSAERQPGSGYGAAYPVHGATRMTPEYAQGQPMYGRDRRPGTVTAACVLTWVGSAVVAAFIALLALVLAADRARFLREFQRQADARSLEVSQEQVLAIAWTVIGVTLFWCLAAAVLAVLAFRRSRAGRVALAVSAAMTVLVSLVLILSVVAAFPLLLGIGVLVLLFTGGANDWYARRPAYPQLPGGYPGGPSSPPVPPPPPSGRPGPW